MSGRLFWGCRGLTKHPGNALLENEA